MKKQNTYSNIYIGVVIQNNDPDKMGGVKIYIPGVTDVLYEGWKEINENKVFKLIDGDLLSVIDMLLEELPWSKQAQGLFGSELQLLNRGNGNVRNVTRISDESVKAPPIDGFGHDVFTPGDYSGSAPGVYSVPSVGSHVYVFFLNGDVRTPVYFSAFHNATDWNSIYKGLNYPNEYENDGNDDSYESKHVINTGKHTLEFIDTDKKEEIKLTHFTGSNLSLNNAYNSEYATGDKMLLVDNNNYSTINNNEYIRISGDAYREILNRDTEDIRGSKFSNVDIDQTTTIGKNNYCTIGENRASTIFKNDSLQVFGQRYEEIKDKCTLNIGKEYTIKCDLDYACQVGGNLNATIDGDYNITVNSSMTYMIAGIITIKTLDNIVITTPSDIKISAFGALHLTGFLDTVIGGVRGVSINSGLDTSIVSTMNTFIDSGGLIRLSNLLANITISNTGSITIGNLGGSITIDPTGGITIKGTRVSVVGEYVGINGGVVAIN